MQNNLAGNTCKVAPNMQTRVHHSTGAFQSNRRAKNTSREHPLEIGIIAPPELSRRGAKGECSRARQGNSALHCLGIYLYAACCSQGRRGDDAGDGDSDRVQP